MTSRSGPRSKRSSWRALSVRRLDAFVPAVAALVLALTLGACASGGGGGASSASGHSRSVITTEELRTAGSESAYDVISRMRPEYFREKPSQKSALYADGGLQNVAEKPALIVNGQRQGDFGDLHTIAVSTLSMIRYYSIEEAKRKFGMQFGGGAIELTYATPQAP